MPQRLFEVWESKQIRELEEFLAGEDGAKFLAKLAEQGREISFGETSECHGIEALVLTPKGIKIYEGLHSASVNSSGYKDATAELAVKYFRRYNLYYELHVSVVDWLKSRAA